MRILIVTPYALPHIGGIQTLVDQEVRTLAALGHDVVLVTSSAGEGIPPEYDPSRVTVHRVPAWDGLADRFQVYFPLFSPRILPILWREAGRADVVHAHGFLFMCSFLAVLFARCRGRLRTLTEHLGVHSSSKRWYRWLSWLAVATVGRLTVRLAGRGAAYDATIVELLGRLGGHKFRAELLTKPVDPNVFFPVTSVGRETARGILGWDARPRVLFVGRLIPDKGIQWLLIAKSEEYDLVFCGPGSASHLGSPLPNGVEILAPRSQEQLRIVYHAADLLVHPSFREGGIPLVVLEALCCGLPVVMTPHDGLRSLPEWDGLTFAARDPDALREAILKALASRRARGVSPPPIMTCFQEWVAESYRGLIPPRAPIETGDIAT